MCKRLLSYVLIVLVGTFSSVQIISASSYENAMESSIAEASVAPEKTVSDELFGENFDEPLDFEDSSNLVEDSLITSVTDILEDAPVPESENESINNSFSDIIDEDPEPETIVLESTESEVLVGSSSYQLQVRWLDGGIRSFALGSFQSSSNAIQSARDLLTKIGLYDRCSITNIGTNIIATVKKVPKSVGSLMVVAHTGYTKSAPENTLSSIRMAAAYGFTDVEFDVRFTKDKIPVLSHDVPIHIYGRNPDGSQIPSGVYVKNCTYAQLLKYDFGIRRGSIWKGEKIPTLEDVLRVCQKSGLRPNLDIKWEPWVTDDMLGTIYALVEKYGFHSNVNYMSSAMAHLKYFAERNPDAMFTLIAYRPYKGYIQNAENLKALVRGKVYIYIHEWLLTEGVARTCRFHNIRLNTAVKTRDQIAKLDRWVSSISASTVEPNTVRTEASKRKAYTVISYDDSIQACKDYGFYPFMDCSVCMHMLASRVGRPIVVSNDNSIAEMNSFRFKKAPNGRYYILSTRCMFAIGTNSSGKIILKEPSSTDLTVQWDIIENSNRTYSFVNASTGSYLATSALSDGSVMTVSNTATDIQTQFYLALSPKQVSVRFEGGRFSIRPFMNEQYAMGVKGGSLNENAPVHITTKNKAYRAQHFYLIYSGDGYYRIKNEYSGKCLEMKNGYVVQTSWNNKSSQRWKILWKGGTLYTFECKAGGNMNVKNSRISVGTLVNKAAIYKGSPYQKWYLRYD